MKSATSTHYSGPGLNSLNTTYWKLAHLNYAKNSALRKGTKFKFLPAPVPEGNAASRSTSMRVVLDPWLITQPHAGLSGPGASLFGTSPAPFPAVIPSLGQTFPLPPVSTEAMALHSSGRPWCFGSDRGAELWAFHAGELVVLPCRGTGQRYLPTPDHILPVLGNAISHW